jgi:DNA-binding transcriptional MocR family regulator
MKRSAIREILKHLQQPGMISFAGGLPAPETFPVNDLKEIADEILENDGPESLQYGTTEGDPLLRKMLVERRTQMISCFRKYMPEGVRWTEPQGGLFLFVTLPPQLDADEIFKKAIVKNVAFVAGSSFYCNNSGHNTMRINFSFSNNTEIEEGVKRLSQVICDELNCK